MVGIVSNTHQHCHLQKLLKAFALKKMRYFNCYTSLTKNIMESKHLPSKKLTNRHRKKGKKQNHHHLSLFSLPFQIGWILSPAILVDYWAIGFVFVFVGGLEMESRFGYSCIEGFSAPGIRFLGRWGDGKK